MFSLVALVFLVANGVQSDKPMGAFRNGHDFPTEKACKEFQVSGKGIEEQKVLAGIIEKMNAKNDENHKVTIALKCIAVEDNKVD